MTALVWPTHKAKARARQKQHLAKAKRSRQFRKLQRSGKRGVVTQENV